MLPPCGELNEAWLVRSRRHARAVELALEVVDASVPVTAESRRPPRLPSNLGFEESPEGG